MAVVSQLVSPGSAAFPAATTPSTSTWSTASTPASRPPVSAPPRPWACAPSHTLKAWQVNAGWVIAANIAANLTAWTRLLGHHDDPGCGKPTPIRSATGSGTCRPGSPRHARQRALAISPDWPWARRLPYLLAAPLRPARTSMTSTNHPSDKEDHPGAVGAGAHPGQHALPPHRTKTDMMIKNRHQHNQ